MLLSGTVKRKSLYEEDRTCGTRGRGELMEFVVKSPFLASPRAHAASDPLPPADPGRAVRALATRLAGSRMAPRRPRRRRLAVAADGRRAARARVGDAPGRRRPTHPPGLAPPRRHPLRTEARSRADRCDRSTDVRRSLRSLASGGPADPPPRRQPSPDRLGRDRRSLAMGYAAGRPRRSTGPVRSARRSGRGGRSRPGSQSRSSAGKATQSRSSSGSRMPPGRPSRAGIGRSLSISLAARWACSWLARRSRPCSPNPSQPKRPTTATESDFAAMLGRVSDPADWSKDEIARARDAMPSGLFDRGPDPTATDRLATANADPRSDATWSGHAFRFVPLEDLP